MPVNRSYALAPDDFSQVTNYSLVYLLLCLTLFRVITQSFQGHYHVAFLLSRYSYRSRDTQVYIFCFKPFLPILKANTITSQVIAHFARVVFKFHSSDLRLLNFFLGFISIRLSRTLLYTLD
ncbi:uncharacterized protein RSE6_13115 [Rhynchosporium secalis]|uniref:Uncharacterized protein n=1 Tax=Rhynchosporium secalis TaxID=38038 RepID=A0A1E1MS35_RHYSE|nr:uncharacterized protein RSE6_13115 [Rhynchosporium secalis]